MKPPTWSYPIDVATHQPSRRIKSAHWLRGLFTSRLTG